MSVQLRLPIAVFLSLVTAPAIAQQASDEAAELSAKRNAIATKIFENLQALSNISFEYNFDVDGGFAFQGKYLASNWKGRVERHDLGAPHEMMDSPEGADRNHRLNQPRHRIHAFDGKTHRQLSAEELFFEEVASVDLDAPFGFVKNPIQIQYGWHCFPSVDGFGVRINDIGSWKDRFSDAVILGEEIVDGHTTTVVAIRSFPKLPIDLDGRHKVLYLAQDLNLTPIKFTIEGEATRPVMSVSEVHTLRVDGADVFVPLQLNWATLGHQFHSTIMAHSIVTNPKVDASTFSLKPPAGFIQPGLFRP